MIDRPPAEAYTAVARRILDAHLVWGEPHVFVSLVWGGTAMSFGTVAHVDQEIRPYRYPEFMRVAAAKELEVGVRRPCGYAFRLEAHTRDVLPGRLVEIVTVACVDLAGGLWIGVKRRAGGPKDIRQAGPDDPARGSNLVRGLAVVAASAASSARAA